MEICKSNQVEHANCRGEGRIVLKKFWLKMELKILFEKSQMTNTVKKCPRFFVPNSRKKNKIWIRMQCLGIKAKSHVHCLILSLRDTFALLSTHVKLTGW